jgi:hypothetical protein
MTAMRRLLVLVRPMAPTCRKDFSSQEIAALQLAPALFGAYHDSAHQVNRRLSTDQIKAEREEGVRRFALGPLHLQTAPLALAFFCPARTSQGLGVAASI